MADTQFVLESDSPALPDLMFWQLLGVESFSRPSRFLLAVLSKNRQISPDDVLGKSFTLKLEFQDAGNASHKRAYQGHATRMRRVGDVAERHCMYHIELDSWFGLLRHRTNARIFQEKAVDEVLKTVLQDPGICTVENVDYGGLRETHRPRRYCVQYVESDFDFLSRLFEDEGIYYWFDNAGDADGKKMKLADNVSVHEKLPVETTMVYAPEASAGEARFNEVQGWWSERSLQSGAMDMHDRDFKKIRSKVGQKVTFKAQHDHAEYEVFEFPGGFFDKDNANRVANLRADERIVRNEACWMLTRWPDVALGRVFQLKGYTDAALDVEWLISRCLLVLSHPGYEGIKPDLRAHDDLCRHFLGGVLGPMGLWAGIDRQLASLAQSRASHAYLAEVIPANITYRPQQRTPRLQLNSPHTAIVVGPPGDEIHMDKFGRVKVQFHWDRYGKDDDKSTAWIRVSQPWAGQQWGGQFIPRIGQEVIVDFLYGDPDRPIIVGRVYNSDQPIPYESPTQSGIKTRSTPGGGPGNFNEIMFEDKMGDELLSLHAEKNMSTVVENDDSTNVGHDQSLYVTNNRTAKVDGDENLHVEKNQTLTVIKRQVNVVHQDQVNVIKWRQENQIGAQGQANVIGGDTTTVVTGSHSTSASTAINLTAPTLNISAGHIGIAATGANSFELESTGPMKFSAKADRHDSTVGEHKLFAAGGLKATASKIELFAVSDINQTSVGSNTTVIGSNSSGYIGMSSEANMGMSRSTFLGLQTSNFLGLNVSNTLAIMMENVAGVKMENTAGPGIEAEPIKLVQAAMEIHSPGAGAGAAAAAGGGSVAAGVAGALAGLAGLWDVNATLQQYRDAEADLQKAAQEAGDAGLPGLAEALNGVASRARTKRIAAAATMGAVAGVATGPVGMVVGGAALGGLESTRGPSET
jgi:type VI secretion system secreted protein VgrG